MDVFEVVKTIEGLGNVPDNQIQWLIETCEPFEMKEDDHLFKPGDPMDRMFILLEGSYSLKLPQNNQLRNVGTLETPMITGLLPYSRAKEAGGYAQARGDTSGLYLLRDHFHDMIVNHEELTTALVHMMSSRIREFTKLQQQNDKLMALGKLSAGLAHELNNPSAAVVRSAQTLKRHLGLMPEKFKNVMEIEMDVEQVDIVNDLLFGKLDDELPSLSMMEKSSREDEMLDWLDDNEVENSEEVAENLVEFGFEADDLENLEEHVPQSDRSAVFNWLNQVLTTEKIVSEIEDASSRINELVLSIKSYTHMDQSPEKKMADIHEGLDNTLVMLGHKLRKENVELIKKYDEGLKHAEILPSALNQVWTNLIDNAIDAMKRADQKVLTVETRQDGGFVNVHIQDSGSGIPEDIKDKIFDPFFTTKGVGEGTGIGLEVVHRIVTKDHNGSITLQSKPGETIFKVCFPIKAA